MKKQKRILALLIAAVTILSLLPLAVSAANCSHSFGGTRWADAAHPHEYYYFCTYGCGEKYYVGSYMTKSNCAICNPSIGTCYHTGNTWTDSAHPHATVCTNCCAVLSYDTVSGCRQCCSHYSGYTYTDPSHGYYGHDKYFVCYSCGYESYSGRTSYLSSCETCNPPVVSSVSLYAEGPRGSIYSSGILEAVSLPATFTVYADCENCYVTSMYYYDNGYKVTSSGNSISYTAYDYDDFDSFTVYVNTNTGVSDSIAVNFKFARYSEASIKWEYTGAVIRKITQNGRTIQSGLSTEIEFIWGGDLTDSAYDTITGLINSYDGKTYILTGSSLIRVYRPSDNSTIGNYDTYSDFDALCNVAGWTQSTLNAFETARNITISYQAPKAVEGTATWQTTSGTTLYTQSAASASGHSYIKPNQSITVTFNASSYTPSGYTYKGMEWSCGSDTGSSTTKTSYSTAYNTSTSPVNVTFLYEKTATSGSITAYAFDADTEELITTGTTIVCGSKSSSSNPATFTGLPFGGYNITGSAPGYNSAGAYINLSADNPNQIAHLFLTRNSGDVTVYVYDADTNRPISGASISGAASGMTNSSGYCTFSGIPFTGDQTFIASKTGYYSGSATARLSKTNTSETLYIYLEPEPKTGDIYVTVYDAYTYNTISGAYVYGAGDYNYTNYYGEAYFYDVPFGSYYFSASADGYYSDSAYAYISENSQSDSISIYLTPLPTEGDITVYVRDADTGVALSGASVSGGGYSGTTNSYGYTTFYDLSFGSYSFSASKSGYYSNSGYASISTSSADATITIYLTPLPTVGDITVYVKDANTGSLISGATVSGGGYSKTTGSSGYVTFTDMSFATYTFTATKSGYFSNTGSASISIDSIDETITIYLTPHPTVGDITVYVKDANTGSVISGATVSGGGYSKTTNSSGYAAFTGIPLNTYTFSASKSGYFSGSGSGSITINDTADTVTIYLTPHPTEGDITVYVKNATTGAALSGASVSGGGYSGTTNSSGYITFSDIPLQSYTFTANKSGFWENSGSASIDINDTTDSITIYLTPHPTEGDITVYVKDKETGAALSGATVSGGGYSKTTNASGIAKFTDIPLQNYTFTASLYGYTSASGSASITIYDTDESITIYLEKKKADVGILSEDINGTIYRGSTIMVSAEIVGDALIDFTPDVPLTVTMTATRNGGTVFDTQTITAICPAGESNLVWFSVDIPETGYTSANVSFKFTVSTPADIGDANTVNDVSTKTAATMVLPDRSTPDPSFELEAPSDFLGNVYKTKNMASRSWSVWEWNGGFVKKNYSVRLDVSATLTPDATAVWSEYNSAKRQWTTRSGYGLNTELEASLSGIPSDMWVGNAKVNAYYSEFNYSTSTDKSDMLDRTRESGTSTYSATFEFNPDADSISGGRMHKTPIWYPDGDYSVKYYVYDLWTPAGMLTGYTYATIGIEGSLYDDYYTQRS